MDTIYVTRADLEALVRRAWDHVSRYYRPEDVSEFVATYLARHSELILREQPTVY